MGKIVIGVDGNTQYSVGDGTRDITLSGLSFTPILENILYVFNKTQNKLYYAPAQNLAKASLTGLVITFESSFPALVTGDILHIQVYQPNNTDVETLISSSNLGITGTADGTSTATVIDDTGASFSTEDVAVGFLAYSEEEGIPVEVEAVTSLTSITTEAGLSTWAGDTYWLPECERYEIKAEGFDFLTIHTKISATAFGNTAYMKIYGTLDANADLTDDTAWIDLSADIFGGTLECSSIDCSEEGIYFVDQPTAVLKYMIKIVGQVSAGGAGAVAGQTFNVLIKKSSNNG